jgi:hypothetical protein
MRLLQDSGPMTNVELSERLGVAWPELRDSLCACATEGLLTRRREDDAILYTLTNKGTAYCERNYPPEHQPDPESATPTQPTPAAETSAEQQVCDAEPMVAMVGKRLVQLRSTTMDWVDEAISLSRANRCDVPVYRLVLCGRATSQVIFESTES